MADTRKFIVAPPTHAGEDEHYILTDRERAHVLALDQQVKIAQEKMSVALATILHAHNIGDEAAGDIWRLTPDGSMLLKDKAKEVKV